MNINQIRDTILDESSSSGQLRSALDAFSDWCSQTTGIRADPGFTAWAGDTLLENGVAINPQAAAHCVADYTRSVAFIRGACAAIQTLQRRFPAIPIEILYAGCGPFATLMLPLLGMFKPGDLTLHLLDVHQRSLDSVNVLISELGLENHAVRTIRADACTYSHAGTLHLVVAETMQKSLEQEPQFAVTANLAPQLCPRGVFIPQRIDVSLCLADLEHEKNLVDTSTDNGKPGSCALVSSTRRYPLGILCSLTPEFASEQMQLACANAHGADASLEPLTIEIPVVEDIVELDAALYTSITVFEQYRLEDYESQITLPAKCFELSPLVSGQRYRVRYQLGSYPKFCFERLTNA